MDKNQNDLIVHADSNQRITYANQIYCDTFGISNEEVVGYDFKQLIHSEDINHIRDSLKLLKTPPHITHYEERAKTVKGWKWFTWTAKANIDESGNISEINAIGRDVTKVKKEQEKLLQKKNQIKKVLKVGELANKDLKLETVLKNVLEGTVDALNASIGMIFLKDPSTGYLKWGASIGLSDAFINDFKEQPIQLGEGLSGRIALSGDPIYIQTDSFHDPRIVRNVIKNENLNSFIGVPIIALEQIVGVMNILTRPPEILFEDDLSLCAAIGTNVGMAIRNVHLFEKISNTEKNLIESKSHLKILVDTIPDLIWLKDPDGIYLGCNPTFERFFGAKESIIVGKTDYAFVDKDLADFFRDHDRKAMELDKPSINEEWLTFSEDGYHGLFETIKTPMRSPDGELIGVLGIARDISERKKAEEKLKNSEIKLKHIIENSTNLFYSHTADHEITFVSPQVRDLLGYEPEEVMRRWTELVTDNPINEEGFKRTEEAIKTGKRQPTYHLELERKDSKKITVEVREAPVTENGKVISIVGSLADITERKQIADALIKSEQKWRHVLLNTPQIGISLDTEARIVFANAHFQQLTGWKKEEIIGRDWFDMFIPDTIREEVREVFKQVMRQKDTSGFSTYENDIVAKNGQLLHIGWSNVFTKDAQGQIVDITSLGVDITERARAEKALKESETKYRSMMEAMTDPVYICSDNFRIEYMNSAMIKKVGCDATGEFCHKVVYDEDEKCSWCVFNQIRQGKHIFYEKKDSKNGRFYSINSLPVDRPDAPSSMLSIFRDITEIKMMEKERIAAEAKLQQASKMESIGTLAGGIAHDFNNILSAVIGYTELSLDEVEGNTILEENLKEVYSAGLRAKELVKQILTFARQTDNEIKPVQVDIIVKEALKFLRSSIPTTIEIRQNIQSDSLIMGDSTQVHQILMNFCTNAVQAIGEKSGVLTVDLTDVRLDADFTKSYENFIPGDYLKLAVSDTGPGISPEIIASIFEPYFTTKAPGEGTGLGLSTVHGIVKQYGGDIMVDSEVGKGSTFNVYLPITKKRTITRPYQAEALPAGNERILIVDDELPIAKMGRQILEKLGYSVTMRTGSVEALELFRSKPDDFDLVVTDMTMPNMTGDQMAIELMKIRPDIPVILCTGYSKEISDDSAASIGIKAFAYKPIVKADFAKTVRKVLDEAKSSTHA